MIAARLLGGGLLLTAAAVSAADSAAADWPCWRGPGRNGVGPGDGGPPRLPEGGDLKPVWTSETILSERDGGYGSPVVADGRVYVYCCWRTKTPVTYRIVREENLADIGVRRPPAVDDAAHAAIEAARVSDERKAVLPDDLDGWMDAWAAANLPAEMRRASGVTQYVNDRLRRGANAPPLDALEILATILGRRFENAAALDEWAAGSGIEPSVWRGMIRPRIPDYERSEEDMLFCLDAATGATLWKHVRPSGSTRWSSSTTPCVADGAVFYVGARGTVYAIDARTGEERWAVPIANPAAAGNGFNSAIAHADGRIFMLAGRLVALDAATGRILWEQTDAGGFNSSPAIWRCGGRALVLAGESRNLIAADAATGAVVWRAPATGSSSPAVDGDLLAVGGGKGLTVYRMSTNGAERIASADKGGSKGGSLIAAGSRVFSGSFEAACLNTTGGSLVWSGPRGLDHYSSGILAHGALWVPGKRGISALDPATGAEIGSIRVDYLRCSSPAFAGGRMFVRTRKGIACYDLGLRK